MEQNGHIGMSSDETHKNNILATNAKKSLTTIKTWLDSQKDIPDKMVIKLTGDC